MKLFIVAAKFLKADGSFEVGGVESYILQLINALKDNYEIVIYQKSVAEFEKELEGVRVIGKRVGLQHLVDDYLLNEIDFGDIILISTEQLNVKVAWEKTVVIQHGIYWDLETSLYSKSLLSSVFPTIYKLWDGYRNVRRIDPFTNIVCVDYIYKTWYNSFFQGRRKKVFNIIPNHASDEFFSQESRSTGNVVRILFARRFMRFRGTVEFCEACKLVLSKGKNIKVTICGEGPDEGLMKSILPPDDRVIYIREEYKNMPGLVNSQDIVVIPSLGSEGTSLSAIEGMASGKAVIASSIGGVTNTIIDGYNGLLVPPGDSEELAVAIERLVNSKDLRLKLGKNARHIAKESFSFGAWALKWHSVLRKMSKEK